MTLSYLGVASTTAGIKELVVNGGKSESIENDIFNIVDDNSLSCLRKAVIFFIAFSLPLELQLEISHQLQILTSGFAVWKAQVLRGVFLMLEYELFLYVMVHTDVVLSRS